MSAVNSSALLAAAGGDYEIQRSVRLRASATAYFSRAAYPVASAGTQWSMSMWVKRGDLSTVNNLFTFVSTAGAAQQAGIQFDGNGAIRWWQYAAPSYQFHKVTTAVFRDPSALYYLHFVYNTTLATAEDRCQVWVNGVRQTSFSINTNPSQNLVTYYKTGTLYPHIGAENRNALSSFTPLDGYLTEVNFIDGQALDPSYFGETDAVTGVWKPKKYAGTYGTNGFYLNFSDNSAATAAAIGKDYSGNGNNWTPNNISVTAGATYDSMLDVPTMWADGGNGRGNYCTLNPIDTGGGSVTLSGGNLNYAIASSTGSQVRGTVGTDLSSKWYWEFTNNTTATPSTPVTFGISTLDGQITNNSTSLRLAAFIYTDGGSNYVAVRYINGVSTIITTQFRSAAIGDVIQVAYDAATGNLWFGKNNTWYDAVNTTTGNPSAGTNPVFTLPTGSAMTPFLSNLGASYSGSLNCGQRPFAYTPPTGFKALNTQNLPEPTIPNGRKYFDTTIYTGNGTADRVISGYAFSPSLVWSKQRSNVNSHQLTDIVRGPLKGLTSNSTATENTFDAIRSFTSDGYTLGISATVNANAATYVNWAWKEGATQGFDIVTYTGTGVAQNVAHSLGVAPSMLIVKNRTGLARQWTVYHRSIANSQNGGIYLNLTNAWNSDATLFNNTAPTSSQFTVGTYYSASGDNLVAYLFAEVPGFSKFGSYTGNGSADGPFVFCGFRPAFVMVKRTNSTGDWNIFDSARNAFNTNGARLWANLASAEGSGDSAYSLFSNGFKLGDADGSRNASGSTYIFMAFAENPFKNSLAR